MITQLTGNGRVLLTVNEKGEWNDLFYPYPGQFQHLREARLGLFDADNQGFVWLREPTSARRETRTPRPGNAPESAWEWDGTKVVVGDHVHPNHDLVIRSVRLTSPRERHLRLFAYQCLQIAESMYQETAYLDPERSALVHYKHGYYFEFFGEPTFSHATCGEHTLKGLRGTYVDAEDGVLHRRTISHGAADSVLQWDLTLKPNEENLVYLFLALGESFDAADRIRKYVRIGDVRRFENESEAFWGSWITRRPTYLPPDLSARAKALYDSSVLVMRHTTGSNGSIIASPDTRSLAVGGDSYNYCWWRDGGYVSKAMDEAGLYEYAHRFLEFALHCQTEEGFFLHRHFPDGAVGSTWHPPPFIQIDQTATVISAVWHHFKRRADLDVLLDLWPLVKRGAAFLTKFRDPATGLPAASYDLWEERKAVHTYSTACVLHALERSARIAEELGKDPNGWRSAAQEIRGAAIAHLWDEEHGRFRRSLDETGDHLDASVLLALKLGLLPWADPRSRLVVDAIEKRLWSPKIGGLARYEGDQYYGRENPWIICTLWLAEARLNLGEPLRCQELIEWVASHASPTYLLPEQVDAETGEPKSAVPLVWSHSTYVDVVHKLQRALQTPTQVEE
ncbi:MAG: glycoside hydrolase family 15 protein [Thermoplasmata archaeon]|nr:glycoside hydrolase family 15 protein [Thermoplasmata archaeon]